jgi:hypothetical protein
MCRLHSSLVSEPEDVHEYENEVDRPIYGLFL